MNIKIKLLFMILCSILPIRYIVCCTNCGGINPNIFYLINSGYTHGAPIEAVAFLCDSGIGYWPLAAIGGHTALCSGQDYPVSLRICSMNPDTGVLDSANCMLLHPTDHVYGLSWCYVPATGTSPEQILLAVVGSANSNDENVWIYEVAGGTPANATLIAAFKHGEGALLSVDWLCQDCSSSGTSDRLLAIGGEFGNGPDDSSPADIRTLQLTITDSNYTLNQVDYTTLGIKVYQVAFNTCPINGCYFLAAGAQPDMTSLPTNFQLFSISCNGILTQILDPILVGNQSTKVRTVAWCCIDCMRSLIAITIDPELPGQWDQFPADSNLLVFFYNFRTNSLMPVAYKSLPGTLLSSAWNQAPECGCKHITIGGGCTQYCIENIFELGIDCSKAPHYPNEMLEIAKRNFDDNVTSLAWCYKPGISNCSYLLAGSESKSFDPYAIIDPVCFSDEDPCAQKDFAIFKSAFCQRPVHVPLPVCERLAKNTSTLKRLK